MRKLMGALLPAPPAISFKATISCSDSTLNIRMPELSAYSISSFFLPTPEKTILFGSAPALSARNNSPPETMSNPPPALAKVRKSAMLEFAFTEKQTMCGIFPKASSKRGSDVSMSRGCRHKPAFRLPSQCALRARPQQTFLHFGIQNDASWTSRNFDFIGWLAQRAILQLGRYPIAVDHLLLNVFIHITVLLLFDKFFSILEVHRRQRPIRSRAVHAGGGNVLPKNNEPHQIL